MNYQITRNTCFFLLIAFFIQFTGCKSNEKATGRQPEAVNYSQYSTFNFGKPHVISSKNPVFSWPQFQERIEREIAFTLPGKGLDLSSRDPDLRVYYYAVVQTEEGYPLLPYQTGWAARPFIENGESFSKYVPNTLVIDLVDTNNNQLVWRGSTRINFDDTNTLYKELPKKVYSLLNQYPTLPEQ